MGSESHLSSISAIAAGVVVVVVVGRWERRYTFPPVHFLYFYYSSFQEHRGVSAVQPVPRRDDQN